MFPRVLTQKAKSYASSPHSITNYFQSHHSSPMLKDSPQVQRLLQTSLKKFKDEKVELEKIKELTLTIKQSRKKKLDKHNLKTRLENKAKLKPSKFHLEIKSNDGIDEVETTNWPNTCNKGHESNRFNNGLAQNKLSDNTNTHEEKINKKSKSVNRRANIGLEFFHLKTGKLSSPKNEKNKEKNKEKNPALIKIENKVKISKKLSKDLNKKDLLGFIKKKRKERIFKTKQEKAFQHENELKRLKQLMKLEKEAKKVLKRKKVLKSSRAKHVPDIFTRPKDQTKSICYSEDEEVMKIIHEKKSGSQTSAQIQDYIQIPVVSTSSKLTAKGKLKLRAKPSTSLKPNTSNPIIELKSISRSSSSDLSEQKQSLKKRIQEIKFRLKFVKDPSKFPLTNLLKAQNIFEKLIFRSLNEKFFLIKYYKNEEKKSLIESFLFSSNVSRNSSEDMEKIWDRVEFYKSVEFLHDRDSLSSLTSIEDFARLSKPNSKKPSEEIPNFALENLKNPQSCRASIDIDEISQEYLDSSSKTLQDDEEILAKVNFLMKNFPMAYPLYQLEPEAYQEKRKSEILIDANSVSMSLEIFSSFKDPDSIDSPEEEIEEFDSSKILVEAKEPDIYENLFLHISELLLSDLLNQQLEKASMPRNPTKPRPSFFDPGVKTSVTSVCNLVESIWLHIDQSKLMNSISSQLNTIYLPQPDQSADLDTYKIPSSTLTFLNPNSSQNELHSNLNLLHSQMVLDCVNNFISNIVREARAKFWQQGQVPSRFLDLDIIFRLITKEIRKCCLVNAGRVANISMINSEGVIDENLLQRIRENGLSAMLTGEIEDIEKEWIDYETDEISVCFQVSDSIFSDLFGELVGILILCNLNDLDIFRS